MDWVVSDIKCRCNRVSQFHHHHWTDHLLFQGGGGEERPQQYWVKVTSDESVCWIQRPANVGAYISSFLKPTNHRSEPRDKSSWLANLSLKVAVALPRHSIIVTVEDQSTFSFYASLFLATGGVLIILMFWWHVKLMRSRIKRFWIGTNSMSSCIHLYWWYLLKSRVNLIWDTQCAWLCRAYL